MANAESQENRICGLRKRKVSIEELATKNRELERKLKQREMELAEERETVEILKKFGFNQFWCGDITYIRTNLGWVYLPVRQCCNGEFLCQPEKGVNLSSNLR